MISIGRKLKKNIMYNVQAIQFASPLLLHLVVDSEMLIFATSKNLVTMKNLKISYYMKKFVRNDRNYRQLI
nr:MAG TPA: hypothetical protein [Caudoviricetes sp.]